MLIITAVEENNEALNQLEVMSIDDLQKDFWYRCYDAGDGGNL